MVSTKVLGSDIEYPLRSNTLSAKSVLGGRVALTIHLIPDAPATVSEWDTSESDAEDNQDECEDTGGGKKNCLDVS